MNCLQRLKMWICLFLHHLNTKMRKQWFYIMLQDAHSVRISYVKLTSLVLNVYPVWHMKVIWNISTRILYVSKSPRFCVWREEAWSRKVRRLLLFLILFDGSLSSGSPAEVILLLKHIRISRTHKPGQQPQYEVHSNE